MSKRTVYQEIKEHCTFIWLERSPYDARRCEYWRHGCMMYTVLIKATDDVARIYARVLN